MIKVLSKSVLLIGLFISVLSLNGCEKKETGGYGEFSVNVVAFKSQKQPVSENISLVGNMAANEYVEIKSEIDGIIEFIGFEEGQRVKKGDILFRVDEKKLRAALAQVQANLKLSHASAERYKALIQSKAVSQQEYEQAIATLEMDEATVDLTKAQLSDALIVAPFDGIMGARSVSEGQFIAKGASLSSIINQDLMKAEFNVPERYLNKVQQNQDIEIIVAAYPDKKFKGSVYFINPQIDELTRTVLVKAKVPNGEGLLRRGMFANLNLIVDVRDDAIVIPESAIMLRGESVNIFAVDEEGFARLRQARVGLRFDGMVQIVSGLSEGEIVVVEGHQKLREGVKVNMKFQEETPQQ